MKTKWEMEWKRIWVNCILNKSNMLNLLRKKLHRRPFAPPEAVHTLVYITNQQVPHFKNLFKRRNFCVQEFSQYVLFFFLPFFLQIHTSIFARYAWSWKKVSATKICDRVKLLILSLPTYNADLLVTAKYSIFVSQLLQAWIFDRISFYFLLQGRNILTLVFLFLYWFKTDIDINQNRIP